MQYSKFMANLYRYDDNIQKEISGVSRFETIGKNVKLSVKLCFAKRENGKVSVYLIGKSGDNLTGKLIFEGKMRQRIFAMQKIISEDEIKQSGLKVSEIKGVCITFNENSRFAALWDLKDIEFDKINFSDRIKYNESVSDRENTADNGVLNNRMTTDSEAEGKILSESDVATGEIASGREVTEEKESASESVKEAGETASGREVTEEKESASESMVETDESESDREVTDVKESASESVVETDESESDREVTDVKESASKSVIATNETVSGSENAANAENPADYMSEPVESTNINKNITGMENRESNNNIYYGEKVNLIKLRELPKSAWKLGNNSFLLHGYYNYHYIYLRKEENRWIVGVPGVYYPQEERMAIVFGFPEFVPVGSEKKDNGTFGYWCKSIDISE